MSMMISGVFPHGEEQAAVAAIFRYLEQEGHGWYSKSEAPGVAYLTGTLRARWSPMESKDVDALAIKSNSAFTANKMIVVVPDCADKEPVTGVWCRWNFDKSPSECHFYLGLWSKGGSEEEPEPCGGDGEKTPENVPSDPEIEHGFSGYRFESPHEGLNHDYFHCQPCRSMGRINKVEPNSALLSENGPTFALVAANNVELALNLVLAMRGRDGLRQFKRKIFIADTKARNSAILKAGFDRLLPPQTAAA